MGIGKATVQAFLAEGDRVIFTARREAYAHQFLQEEKRHVDDKKLFYVKCDQCAEKDIENVVKQAVDLFGGCDVLVNNAAAFVGGVVHENTLEEYDSQFDTNVRSVFLFCKYCLPHMMARKAGNIINVASLAGLNGAYNMTLYSAAKAAVVSMSRSMGLDYARHGIRVNCVCPSATASDMFLNGTTEAVMDSFVNNNPSGRIGKPSDIADAIVFLASEKASYINAHVLSVDGGLAAWNGEPRQDKGH